MLVLIPHGCDEDGVARLIRRWVSKTFTPPSIYANHRTFCIDIVADGLETSAHFAHSVKQKIARHLQIEVEGDASDFPSDTLLNSIEAAIAAGAYPILTIERFHKFANIRDGGMTTMLSRLRSMESDGRLTTLAFSPMSYDALRKKMDHQQPFLTSVYGDTHDMTVMTPLTREEFVAEAEIRGLDRSVSHRLFGYGGGPDAVFSSLLDTSDVNNQVLVEKCAQHAGGRIDQFLARALPELPELDPLIENLAVGRLSAAQEAALLSHPLRDFLCKRNAGGELVCSSPVIARRILAKGMPIWARYGACIEAIEREDYANAQEIATNLVDTHPRLAAFRDLVLIRGALNAVPDRGLLGIDWTAASQAMKRVRQLEPTLVSAFAPWLDAVEAALHVIIPSSANRRLQADDYTRRASDRDLRLLLLFMMDGLVCAVQKLSNPPARVHALVNLPEAILQTLAAGFCAIDFADPPKQPLSADYDAFFGNTETFRFPAAGQKLTLGALLVIVPAILAIGERAGSNALTDPNRIKPLQQKLVDAVRNPASHTIANFALKDATLLEEISRGWIDVWCQMEGLESTDALPIRALAPSNLSLRALVID